MTRRREWHDARRVLLRLSRAKRDPVVLACSRECRTLAVLSLRGGELLLDHDEGEPTALHWGAVSRQLRTLTQRVGLLAWHPWRVSHRISERDRLAGVGRSIRWDPDWDHSVSHASEVYRRHVGGGKLPHDVLAPLGLTSIDEDAPALEWARLTRAATLALMERI